MFVWKGADFWEKKGPCQEHSRDEHRIWVKTFFSKRARIQLLNARSGAADPINPPNLFVYSFKHFWAEITKIHKNMKIILIVRILPFKGNREGPPKALRRSNAECIQISAARGSSLQHASRGRLVPQRKSIGKSAKFKILPIPSKGKNREY